MRNIGLTELIIIVVAILVLFGARKIPDFMRGIGQGMREFRKGMRGEDDEVKRPMDRENGGPSKN